ncbi:unnamed protein product [Peniophora sp. CBMAI 1063]|nr:unnamed protein product [Peniophora sp. CBMAI 1063]
MESFPWHDIDGYSLRDLMLHLKHPAHDDFCLYEITSTLRRLNTLKTFELRTRGHDGSLSSRIVKDSAQSIHLPNIERITLEANSEMVVRFLDLVSFPTSVETTLIPLGVVERASILSTLLPWISKQSASAPVKRLSFTSSHHGDTTQLNVARSLHTGHGEYLHLHINSLMQDATREILHGLEPGTVQVIDVATVTPLSLRADQLLVQTSLMCRNVTRIDTLPVNASNDAAGALAAILRRLLLPPTTTTSSPFPVLVTLNLLSLGQGVLSSRCTHSEDAQPYRIMPPTLAQAIVDILIARQEVGGTMPRVYVQEWTSPMSRFEQSVLEVVRTIPGALFLPAGTWGLPENI